MRLTVDSKGFCGDRKGEAMITLHVENYKHEFKVGEVRHLLVKNVYESSPGRWRLEVRDVTPLPGAEPTGYACGICGLVEPASLDGSLPAGWVKKEFQGSKFACPDCKKAIEAR